MKRVLILTCAMLFAPAVCPADEINVSGMAYTNVKITGFDGKVLSFTFLGRPIKKDISRVESLVIVSDKKFTEAEALVAVGRHLAAVQVYEAAGRLAAEPWRKKLIAYRMEIARAKAGPINGGGKNGTGGNGGATGAKKCKGCSGTGKMPCPHCRARGKATGKVPCTRCTGKGQVSCPQCRGKWQLDACPACKGVGSRTQFDWRWNAAKRKIEPTKTTDTCETCGGKGCTRVCQTCGGQSSELRGTIRCPACQGSGTTGKVCPECKGAKKVTCTFCDGTGVAKKSTIVIAVNPPNGGNGHKPPDTGNGGKTKPPVPVPPAGPLGSPDALAAVLKTEPKHPSEDKRAWDNLTVAQRDGAEEAHAQAMVKWLASNDFHGKKVAWSGTFSDLVKPRGGGYLVNAHTAAGVLIRASVPTDPKMVLRKLTKGMNIQLHGTIREYGTVNLQSAPTAGKKVYRIDLANATVAPL